MTKRKKTRKGKRNEELDEERRAGGGRRKKSQRKNRRNRKKSRRMKESRKRKKITKIAAAIQIVCNPTINVIHCRKQSISLILASHVFRILQLVVVVDISAVEVVQFGWRTSASWWCARAGGEIQ